MLAKMWKKVLLAICILACIFNIMSKLVNRHSLKDNLESVNDGSTVFGIFGGDKEKTEEEKSDTIEGVVNNKEENIVLDNSSVYVTTGPETTVQEENTYTEETATEENMQENSEEVQNSSEEVVNTEEGEESSSNGISYTDLISNFFSF